MTRRSKIGKLRTVLIRSLSGNQAGELWIDSSSANGQIPRATARPADECQPAKTEEWQDDQFPYRFGAFHSNGSAQGEFYISGTGLHPKAYCSWTRQPQN
jgi:hypothetical protein